jgi:hypothetical protein
MHWVLLLPPPLLPLLLPAAESALPVLPLALLDHDW